MSDLTLVPGGPDSDLLFAALAFQLDFVGRADLVQSLELWATDRSRPLSELLVERRALAPHRRQLLEYLLTEYLILHDMDASRGLAAACAARQETVDFTRFAAPAMMRGSLPTLPESPHTLAGPLILEVPTTGYGSNTSAGKRFRVLRPHAQGALGQVFLAHDEELNRQVALKEIQEAYASHRDSRARFLLEAEITGSLEHPGIVPVYGLGLYADGRPYYAMRFIRGESLHEASARFHAADGPKRDPGERALALRGLLGRFVAVCNAIAYAHSRGIMHRDIKPSNVMIGPFGETLVVDWGLAKTFKRGTGDDSKEVPILPTSALGLATILGQAVGTPSFMSPEAAGGRVDQIGPASDIYSLGSTLYNLLTGIPPYQGDRVTHILAKVERNDFVPPRRIKRDIPAALEAIVHKAMAAAVEDRYAGVTGLAQDVERWLADEPVEAYREPIVESVLRWMRRHRPLVTGLAALLLTALVGLGVGLWAISREQDRTARQRDIAEHNFHLARQAVDECFELATKDPLLQQEKMRAVRRLLLQKALPFYQGFETQNPKSANLSFDVGRSYFRVALITSEIGRKSDAIKSYERARPIFEALVRQNPSHESYQSDLAATYNNLGVLLRDTGRRDEALAELTKALALRDQLAGERADIAEYQSDLAATYNNLGDLQRDSNQPEQAQRHFDLARDTLRSLVREHRGVVRYRADLAATQHNMGRLLAEHGDPNRALEAYREAESIRERLAREQSLVAEYRGDLANTLINIASLLHVRRSEEAERCYERARELCDALCKDHPEVAVFHFDLSRACNGLGTLLRKQTVRSVALHTKAAALLESLVKQHPEEYDYQVALAGTHVNLGQAHKAGPRPADALAWFARVPPRINALPASERSKPEARTVLRNAAWGKAEALGAMGKYADSIAAWEEAVRLSKPPDLDILLGRAAALAKAGRHAEASRQAEALLTNKIVSSEVLYDLACIYALSAHAADQDRSGPADWRKKQSDLLAAKAVTLLERVSENGFFRTASKRDYVRKDNDLTFLHPRPDYQAFLKRIER